MKETTNERAVEAVEHGFRWKVWDALKGDHTDLTRQAIILEAHRAALAAARPLIMEEAWQPIETAPRDGTWINAWDGQEVQPMLWVENACDDDAPYGRYTGWAFGDTTWGGVLYSGVNQADPTPTHWQPLPAPPRAAKTDGGGA